MSRRPPKHNFSPPSLAMELADPLATDAWHVLLANAESLKIDELVETLEALDFQLVVVTRIAGDEGLLAHTPVGVQRRGDAATTSSDIAEVAVIVQGLDGWDSAEFTLFDLNRDAIAAQFPHLYVVCTRAAADRLARLAPNVMSFVQGDTGDWSSGEMTQAQVEAYLGVLRRQYGMTDEAVIERAQAGTLPSHADFDTWLILLGRGDLVEQDPQPKRGAESC